MAKELSERMGRWAGTTGKIIKAVDITDECPGLKDGDTPVVIEFAQTDRGIYVVVVHGCSHMHRPFLGFSGYFSNPDGSGLSNEQFEEIVKREGCVLIAEK